MNSHPLVLVNLVEIGRKARFRRDNLVTRIEKSLKAQVDGLDSSRHYLYLFRHGFQAVSPVPVAAHSPAYIFESLDGTVMGIPGFRGLCRLVNNVRFRIEIRFSDSQADNVRIGVCRLENFQHAGWFQSGVSLGEIHYTHSLFMSSVS